jgi:uncharacterized protein involved in outer membrane biogenesis
VKRVLLILAGLIVLLVAVALIAPSFIDWNKYKKEIAEPIERATGRTLAMNGDLSLSVLPTPRVSAADVRLSTAGGDADFLTLRALDVQVALWPLLRGEIQVISVRLVEPEFFLEVAADGTANWQFDTGASAPADESSAAAPISVERVVIANGALNYTDATTGRVERIEAVTATFTADDLVQGPYAAEGRFSVRDQAVGFDISLGAARQDAAMPLRAKLELERGGAVVAVQGSVSPFAADPSIDAKFTFDGGDLREALSIVTKMVDSDAPLVIPGAQTFSITAQLTGTAETLAVNDLVLAVGETRATGAVAASLGAAPGLDVTLAVGRIDLDAWVNAVSTQTAETAPSRSGIAPSPPTNPLTALGGLTASVNVTGEALTFRGGLVRQFRLAASVADESVDLAALSAMLPGGADVSLTGRAATVDGQPRFDGRLELAAADFRAAAEWLGVSLDGVAPGRLRQFSLQSQVRATPDLGQAFGIDLRLDSSRITGGLAYAFRARPSFSVDLEIDRLNLDAYLADDPSPSATGDRAPNAPTGTGAFAVLDTFDTNTKIKIDSLTFGGRRFGGVALDASLLGGALTLREAAIADAGGAGVVVSGSTGNFAAVPAFDTRVAVKSRDVAAPARFFGVDLPVDARALGAIDLGGSVIGTVEDLAVDLTSKIGDMTIAANGRLELLAAAPRVDMRVTLNSPSFVRAAQLAGLTLAPTERALDGALTVTAALRGNQDTVNLEADINAAALALAISGALDDPLSAPAYNLSLQVNHPDMTQLLRTVGVDYRPAAVNLGAVRTLADIAGQPGRITISRIEGALGPVNYVGDAAADFTGPRPRIEARLNTGEILADLFLPVSNSAGGGAASTGTGRSSAQGGDRWSQDPIDLTALQSFDGRLELNARGLIYGDYVLQEPTLVAALEDGTLTVDPLSANLFEGRSAIRVTAVADRVARVGVSLSLDGANIEQALRTSAGLDRVTGRFDMRGDFTTTGQSQFDLVNNLDGNLSFAAQDGVVRGIDLRSLSQRLGNLNEALDFADLLVRTFEGGETRYTAFQGTFRVEDGVARSTDLTATLDAAAGTGTAVVDLPRWRLDMRTSARLTDHPESPDVGLDLTGPLDNPQRNIRTQALEQYLTQRVGTTLIRKLLKDDDRPTTTQPAPAAAPSQDSRIPALPGQGTPTQESKPATGEDLVKGILRRLQDR